MEEGKMWKLRSDFFSSVSFCDKGFSFLFLEVYCMMIFKDLCQCVCVCGGGGYLDPRDGGDID